MPASSSKTVLQSLEWCKRFIFQRPTVMGNFLEPAVTSVNTVIQTMLGAPFRWRWNRQIVAFSTVIGQQDYTVPCNLGWIENASVQWLDTNDSTLKWKEMAMKIDLALDSASSRPHSISAQADDLNGNITFRLMPVPDQIYPISVTVQQKPVLVSSVNSTWTPIPDEYGHIYNWGLLALLYMYADDARFAVANQKFVANLLAANQGLTDTERNIFLNDWQTISGVMQTLPSTIQVGYKGRESS